MNSIIDFLNENECVISLFFSFATFLSLIIGGIFALKQWSTECKLKSADYIISLTDKIRTDTNIAFYLFEYNQRWYDIHFHSGSETEKKVDYTLSFFNYVCYLATQKIITTADFDFFKYQINRVLLNEQCQDYLYNLYHFSKKSGLPTSFPELFNYAKENKYIDDLFYDRNAHKYSDKYHKYLNF